MTTNPGSLSRFKSQFPIRREKNNYFHRGSFAGVRTGQWSGDWENISIGTGMAIATANGNATITTGTTANAETIQRLNMAFDGSLSLRYKLTLSQRIANNSFYVELVDVLGDGLAVTINSATSITVVLPDGAPSFSSENIGQFVTVGAISGAAGIPGRYAIASVSNGGRTLGITVSGWPSSGTCTASLFGWNNYHVLYDGTSATSAKIDSQRQGWASGDSTVTINTTASSHVGHLQVNKTEAVYSDATANSTAFTQRGQRTESLPNDNAKFVLQVRAVNGTSAPAGTTTLTIGFAHVEVREPDAVSVTNSTPNDSTIPAGAATEAKQPAFGTAGAPSADVLSTQGIGYDGTATVTRAANTTVYTANDVVGGPLTIANVGPAAGKIFITDVMLLQNLTAVPSGQTSFRLYLYNVTPPSAIADNSPFTLGSSDRAAFLGYIDIGSPALLGTGTGTPQTQVTQVNMRVTTASTSLFGYLVTNGGFTPAANSETYSLTVKSIGV